jgi:hypothetical protein
VPRAELGCGREGDDGDVMGAQSVRPALRLLAGRAVCMATSCCILHDMEIRSSICVGGVTESCVRAHASVGARLVVRRGDLSCEAETSRARVPLVGNWLEV